MAVTWSSWQSLSLCGCYGPPGMLSCTSRNSHAHRRTQAGRWAEPARVSVECWAGIDRPIDQWPKLGRRPPICRAGPTPVSVLTGAGRLVKRAPPEPRPKCDRVDFRRKNTLGSLANLNFGDFLAIHKFGRRPLDMWRTCRHYETYAAYVVSSNHQNVQFGGSVERWWDLQDKQDILQTVPMFEYIKKIQRQRLL